jgi:hypothetical protein
MNEAKPAKPLHADCSFGTFETGNSIVRNTIVDQFHKKARHTMTLFIWLE